jgi:hypothetical protein
MHPTLRHFRLLPVIALLSLAAACKPEIGDECELSTDCSATGDRLCDTTQPAGYCTIFNCEPGSCPEEAVCIGFNMESARFFRSFCMRTCEGNDDCRTGYECVDMRVPGNTYGATVIESDSGDGKVCAVPESSVAPESMDPGGAGGMPSEPPPSEGGAGGVAGAGGAAGEGGAAGDGEGGAAGDGEGGAAAGDAARGS